MTAINILVQRDAVHLISDGASYDGDQRLVSVGPKVFALPHLNAAIGTRGAAVALPLLAHFVGHAATSYDGLKSKVVDVIKEALVLVETVLDRCVSGSKLDVAIGGISESRGPDAYVVSRSEDGVFSLTQVAPDIGLMPSSIPALDDYVKSLAIRKLFSNSFEVDPVDFEVNVLEIQRAATFGGTCHVGGFGQLTTVRKTGIETRVLHRWPDEVGMPLGNNGALQAASGAIAALAVKSLNIQGNAVTVPVVQNYAQAMSTSTSTFASFNISIDTTGLAGQSIVIYAIAAAIITPFQTAAIAGSVIFQYVLSINGVSVLANPVGSWQTPNATLSGSLSVTATGGVMSIPVSFVGATSAGGAFTITGTLFAIAAKR